MEINRLLAEELRYELRVRGIPTRRTVEDNRKTLRGVMRNEQEGYFFENLASELDPVDELLICEMKIQHLEEDIKNFDYINRENEYRRIKSRLIHVIQRLKRLPENTQTKESCARLLGRSMQALDMVGHAYDKQPNDNNEAQSLMDFGNDEDIPLLSDPNPLLPEIIVTEATRQESGVNSSVHGRQPRLEPTSSSQHKAETNNFPEHFSYTQFKRSVFPTQPFYTSEPYTNHLGTQPLGQLPKQRNGDSETADTISKEINKPYTKQSVRFQDTVNPRNADIVSDPHTKVTTQDDSDVNKNLSSLLRALQFSPLLNGPVETREPYSDISRWRIQFDGQSSVNNFLERVEELRQSRGLSKERLLRSASELFSKDALIWFRTQKFDSWDDLEKKLREAFQPYDYTFDLMEEIRRRTQGAREKVVTYVAIMENLFRRLGIDQPPEETRVKMIQRNLLPEIQAHLALHNIGSIEDLTLLSRKIEENLVRMQRFCPPPTNYRQLLEPELAYRKLSNVPNICSTTISTNESKQRKGTPDNTEDNGTSKSTMSQSKTSLKCFNCKQSGHRFKQCQEKLKKFCYKCGRDNVMTPSCPNCQKNSQRDRN